MCLSIRNAFFRNTTIYSAEVQREGELVHVIGYQNSARSYGPNAMLLPFPAEGDVTRDNLVNGSAFKKILEGYNKAVKRLNPDQPKSARLSRSRSLMLGAPAAASYEVFESGSYTVALCQRPSALGFALKEVPEDRRPDMPYPFLLELTRLYPDWPVALCCFNGNSDSFDAEPLFWWYKPRYNHVLFAPAIDAHDGKPPQLDVMVDRDHTLAFASYASTRPEDAVLKSVIDRDVPAEHRWMFNANVCGREVKGTTGNGDFVLSTNVARDKNVQAWLKDVPVAKPPRDLPSQWDRLLQSNAP